MSNKVQPDPAAFASYTEWIKAKEKYDVGKVFSGPPPAARGVLVWLVLSALVFVAASWVIGASGADRGKELRSGVAQIVECSGRGVKTCEGAVRWSDGSSSGDAAIKSEESVTGEVDVGGWEVWSSRAPSGTFYEEEIWASEYRPESRPLLFPVICLLTLGVIILLGVIVVPRTGRWFVRRSQREWVRARQAAGLPADLTEDDDDTL